MRRMLRFFSLHQLLKLPAMTLRGLIYAYKVLISPILPVSCRFSPTCSEYALEALRRFGLFYGCFLTMKRLSRCHPWGKEGWDPVPNKTKEMNTNFLHKA